MIEYRVRPITRFIVTCYQSETTPNGKILGSCDCLGEFDNEYQANRVATALCKASTEQDKSISPEDGVNIAIPPYDPTELPRSLIREAEWSQAPNSTLWGAGMMVADVALSNDETLTLYADQGEISRIKSFNLK